MNLYRYVGSRPTYYIDPFGLETIRWPPEEDPHETPIIVPGPGEFPSPVVPPQAEEEPLPPLPPLTGDPTWNPFQPVAPPNLGDYKVHPSGAVYDPNSKTWWKPDPYTGELESGVPMPDGTFRPNNTVPLPAEPSSEEIMITLICIYAAGGGFARPAPTATKLDCYCPPTIMGSGGATDFCFLKDKNSILCICVYRCIESGQQSLPGFWIPKK